MHSIAHGNSEDDDGVPLECSVAFCPISKASESTHRSKEIILLIRLRIDTTHERMKNLAAPVGFHTLAGRFLFSSPCHRLSRWRR